MSATLPIVKTTPQLSGLRQHPAAISLSLTSPLFHNANGSISWWEWGAELFFTQQSLACIEFKPPFPPLAHSIISPNRPRRSVVEQQLPKVHVVGSRPIATSRNPVAFMNSHSNGFRSLERHTEKELRIAWVMGRCPEQRIS